MRHNSFKANKFLKQEFIELMLILIINSFYFDFVLSNCSSDIIHYFLTSPSRENWKEPSLSTISTEASFNGNSNKETLNVHKTCWQ